jgi:hypothetical protein
MAQKFIAVPNAIYADVTSNKLIPTDILTFIYLCSKCAHGKPIYLSRRRMCEDLGGLSLSRLSDSLKRLSQNGHVNRNRLNGATSTSLLTFVKDRNHIYIRGRNQNEYSS